MARRELGNLPPATPCESDAFLTSTGERSEMTAWIFAALAFGAVAALLMTRRRRTEKREFDERSDVTKIVLAADRRRKDANAAVRFMREK
mgnify:FL=1